MALLAEGGQVDVTFTADSTLTIECPGGFYEVQYPIGTVFFRGGGAVRNFDFNSGSCRIVSVTRSLNYYSAADPVTPSTSGGGTAVSAAWSTTWDMTAYKDMGDFSITGALALVSSDTGSVVGGCTQAVLIANGTNIPTFDGSQIADFVNTNGTRNLVQLFRAGNSKFWAIGSRTGSAVTVPIAPAITVAPSVGSATVGVALTFTGATATGVPSPTLTYDVLIGGSVVASNVTSGSYTPSSAGGSLVVRATATNASGSAQASSSPVTVAAAPTVPGAPTGLTLGTATSTTQPLTWTAPASNGGSAITDYVVQFSLAGANSWTTFADGTSTATSATVTGLTASTSYDYRVAAVNAIGTGSNSTAATGSTAAGLTVVRQTALVGITESGDAANGWNYATTANDNTYGAAHVSISDKKIASGTDGSFQITLGTVVGANGGPHIAFKTTQAAGAFGSAVAGFYWDNTALTYKRTTGVTGNQATTVTRTPATGDIMRISRSGTNMLMDVSSDGGATFTNVHTLAGITTADVWLQLVFGGTQVNNVRGNNVI